MGEIMEIVYANKSQFYTAELTSVERKNLNSEFNLRDVHQRD